MQIDFHLGVTYVLCRLSGFSQQEADTIACSSQYVDDAINEGVIYFNNQALYSFISSAHRNLDYRNFKELQNHHVWIPFHFIPGNQFQENLLDEVPEFIQKLICRPNSPIAQLIMQNCIEHYHQPYALHLLGVCLHSFVDTWAHQGFAGVSHRINEVDEIFDASGDVDIKMIDHRDRYLRRGLHRPWWKKWLDFLQMNIVNGTAPVGHGPVLSYPDLPYLVWSYKNWRGETIIRNNPQDYMSAIHEVLKHLQQFRLKKNQAGPDLHPEDLKKVEALLRETMIPEPLERLQIWKQKIQSGYFSFGTDTWNYSPEGEESWVYQALGFFDPQREKFTNIEYHDSFMNSNWKLAHDALIFHRFVILNEILPRYGLCAG